jgi:hypothetical protein
MRNASQLRKTTLEFASGPRIVGLASCSSFCRAIRGKGVWGRPRVAPALGAFPFPKGSGTLWSLFKTRDLSGISVSLGCESTRGFTIFEHVITIRS